MPSGAKLEQVRAKELQAPGRFSNHSHPVIYSILYIL